MVPKATVIYSNRASLFGSFFNIERDFQNNSGVPSNILPHPRLNKVSPAKSVGEFYDKYFSEFEKVYGNVIQAFRTNNLENLLNYQFKSAGFKNGDKLLDAGCGVCGPAIHFAKHYEVDIEAISISEKQITINSCNTE